MSTWVLRKRGWESFLVSLKKVKSRLSYRELSEKLGLNKGCIYRMINDDDYIPTMFVRTRINVILQPDKTPGGWVNAVDPEKAARLILKRAQYSVYDLVHELYLEESRLDRLERKSENDQANI